MRVSVASLRREEVEPVASVNAQGSKDFITLGDT
jgi:hypothetical protein